jgi:hypothetical protein
MARTLSSVTNCENIFIQCEALAIASRDSTSSGSSRSVSCSQLPPWIPFASVAMSASRYHGTPQCAIAPAWLCTLRVCVAGGICRGAHNICLSTVHHGWPCGAQRSVLRSDKIRLLGFTTLHDSRRYTIPQCLGPSHPDTKARCTGDDDTLSYLIRERERERLVLVKHDTPSSLLS